MDSEDICAATSGGDTRRRVNKRNRDWHKRLHLRKTAVQAPAMQSADKRRPKTIAGEWEQSTVWPSSKKPPKGAQQGPRRTDDGGGNSALRFACAQCGDDLEYVPKDLVRHFEEKHRGSPPVFSCHACAFSTHEFAYLQVHLLSHKDTFSSCGICHDDVQRTWPELSAHLTARHCQNGKYSCEACPKFSTGDVGVFLEHTYAHHLGLEGAKGLPPQTRGKNKFGPKEAAPALRCQHCGYEASQKWLIAKHVKAVHVCQNGNQRKKKKKEEEEEEKKEEEVRSLAMKPNDPIPKVKPRLTRSAVREMCWLTQDCLSLPGREFLDKYCHLSDPQTTLEETQQFLMKSVAGETGDQKWTKALKTVLSNVPQDMNVHPKSENGIVSNSTDLTVLTVKNKITVAQNGGAYAKRLKVMTSSEKETASLESVPDDARRVVDQNGCKPNSSDHAPCPQAETKPNNDVSLPAQSEPSERTRMQENRESRELKSDQEMDDRGKKPGDAVHEDGISISSGLKLKVTPKNKRRRRKRRARSKRVRKRSPGLALKIVLKKNPVKEKQWVSQSSLSPSGGGAAAADCPGPPSPRTTSEETAQVLQNALLVEAHQKERTKAPCADLDDPSEAIASGPQSKPGEELTPGRAATPPGSNNEDVDPLQSFPSPRREARGDAEQSPQRSGSEVDESRSARETGRSDTTQVETWPEDASLQASGSGTDHRVSDDETSSVTPHSGSTKSSPVSISVITAQGKVNSEDVILVLPAEHGERSVEGARAGEEPADSYPDLLCDIHQGPSHRRWQPLPKHLERTLKLVAISPSQRVKRPVGDQPVVVLNHPDADIPEVARIMEVINRYRGEVQKVMLSRRTAAALSASSGEEDTRAGSAGSANSSVQERFLLKMRLRRLSRKKYEVVDAGSPSGDAAAASLRCWFCGRMFSCREAWTAHRQRHLIEWKKPNCEKS
ncbi:uncharacterized protein znf518a [Lycodopsis pacificus]